MLHLKTLHPVLRLPTLSQFSIPQPKTPYPVSGPNILSQNNLLHFKNPHLDSRCYTPNLKTIHSVSRPHTSYTSPTPHPKTPFQEPILDPTPHLSSSHPASRSHTLSQNSAALLKTLFHVKNPRLTLKLHILSQKPYLPCLEILPSISRPHTPSRDFLLCLKTLHHIFRSHILSHALLRDPTFFLKILHRISRPPNPS